MGRFGARPARQAYPAAASQAAPGFRFGRGPENYFRVDFADMSVTACGRSALRALRWAFTLQAAVTITAAVTPARMNPKPRRLPLSAIAAILFAF